MCLKYFFKSNSRYSNTKYKFFSEYSTSFNLRNEKNFLLYNVGMFDAFKQRNFSYRSARDSIIFFF